MQAVRRYGTSVIVSMGVTLALFTLMQVLIASGGDILDEDAANRVIELVTVDRDETLERKERVERPPEAEKPPEISTPQNTAFNTNTTGITFNFNSGQQVSTGGDFIGDGEYLPIAMIAPQYPQRAQERGIEGYAVLEFTVTAVGTVENPVIIDEFPASAGFGRAAVRAAPKFKYQPRVINGTPVAVEGVRYRFIFELPDE